MKAHHHDDIINNRLDYPQGDFCVGPLCFNMHERTVGVSNGDILSPDAKEFDALVMLATNEGKLVGIEVLHRAISPEPEPDDSIHSMDAVLAGLIDKVDRIPGDFVNIKRCDDGYVLTTRWNRNAFNEKLDNKQGNKQENNQGNTHDFEHAVSSKRDVAINTNRKRPIRRVIYAAVGAAAAVALALVLTITNQIPQNFFDLEDGAVPMAPHPPNYPLNECDEDYELDGGENC